MSTRSIEMGKAMVHGIDTLESNAHDTVHAGADGARKLTRSSARWASEKEVAAARKARMLRRELKQQGAQLSRTARDAANYAGDRVQSTLRSGNAYVKRSPWKSLAIASGAMLLAGLFLGRRR